MQFALQAFVAPHTRSHPVVASSGDAIATAADNATVSRLCSSDSGTPQNPCDHPDCAICVTANDRQTALFVMAAVISIIAPPQSNPPLAAPHVDALIPDGAIDVGAGAPRAPPLFS